LSEVRDHCCFLEEENEQLSMLSFLNARQIADLQTAAGGSGGGAAAAAAGGAERDRAGDRGDRLRSRSRSRSRWAFGYAVCYWVVLQQQGLDGATGATSTGKVQGEQGAERGSKVSSGRSHHLLWC
jgi:hypothetical protein